MSAESRLILELRAQLDQTLRTVALLKEQNRRLVSENQDLRDLCCFLDDDRQKGRALAKEWQKFGKYTAQVMKQEVSSYQSKVQLLAQRQEDLLRDNAELKDLCLFLEGERAAAERLKPASAACNCHCLLMKRPCQASPLTPPLSSSSASSDSSPISHSTPEQLLEELRPRLKEIRTRMQHRSESYSEQSPAEDPVAETSSTESAIEEMDLSLKKLNVATQSTSPVKAASGCDPLSSAVSRRSISRNNSFLGAIDKSVEITEQLSDDSEALDQRYPEPSAENCAKAQDVLHVFQEASEHQMADQVVCESAILKEMCNVVWRSLEN